MILGEEYKDRIKEVCTEIAKKSNNDDEIRSLVEELICILNLIELIEKKEK